MKSGRPHIGMSGRVLSTVRRPGSGTPSDTLQVLRPPSPAKEDGFRWRDKLPPSLQLDGGYKAELAKASQGPSFLVARTQLDIFHQLHQQLQQPEELSQAAYSAGQNERIRDIIHLTLDMGEALQAAMDTFKDATSPEQQSRTDAITATIRDATWARAAYLVAIEASNARRVAGRLSDSVRMRHEVDRLRREALQTETTTGPDGVGRAAQLTQAAEDLVQTERLRSWFVGGTPGESQVGHSGDELMAAMLHQCADACTTTAKSMMTGVAPSDPGHTGPNPWESWAERNAEDATTHPIEMLLANKP